MNEKVGEIGGRRLVAGSELEAHAIEPIDLRLRPADFPGIDRSTLYCKATLGRCVDS